jgi:hypothetical protein
VEQNKRCLIALLAMLARAAGWEVLVPRKLDSDQEELDAADSDDVSHAGQMHKVDPREAKRHLLQTEIWALKDELVLVQEDLNKNRSAFRKGQISRKEAEVSILKQKIAELKQEERDYVDSFYTKKQLTQQEETAKRVAGYYEDIQAALGISNASLKREMPEPLPFHEKGDGMLALLRKQRPRTCKNIILTL